MFNNKKLNTLFTEAEKHIPKIKDYFNFEDKTEDIVNFEKIANITFPETFKNLYSVFNGEIEHSGLFLFSLLPFETIIEEWKVGFKDTIGEETLEFSIIEKKIIKPFLIHPKRIPILSNGGGSFIGFDFTPDIEGMYGQLINLDLSSASGFILKLFNSFDDYIDFLILSLKNKKNILVSDEYSTHFESSYYFWDDFIESEGNSNALSNLNDYEKMCIARYQSKENINDIDLRQVTSFNPYVFPNYVGSLKELEYYPNLKEVIIRGDLSYDYRNLLKCSNLLSLEISHINDESLLESISQLQNLKYIKITYSNLISLNLLSNLKDLSNISIENSYINNIEFIHELKKIQSLTLINNKNLFSLPDLSHITLKQINISESKFSSFPRTNLSNITEINIYKTNINNFSFLAECNSGITIHVSYNQFKEIINIFPSKFYFVSIGFSKDQFKELRNYNRQYFLNS